MNSQSNLPWQRFWHLRGEKPVMDGGYIKIPSLKPESDELFFLLGGAVANVASFATISAKRCLVLLGDVGLGKSTVLRQEYEKAKAVADGSSNQRCLWIDLKGKTETLIHDKLFKTSSFQEWANGKVQLTVFLDSLDECWRHLSQLTEILASGFETDGNTALQPLFLRLACRPGEWHGDLEGRLSALLKSFGLEPKEHLGVHVLASLCADDIRSAAVARNISPDEFLKQVADRDLQALAGQPMTLFMLLDEFTVGNELPKSAAELYRRGCLRLCSDPHTEGNPSAIKRTTVDERLTIAARIASASLLCNRYLINSNSDAPAVRSGVLEIGEIVTGMGTSLDREAASQTLHTGMFSEAEGGLQGWRHASYAEFLAAYHLHHSGLSIVDKLRAITAMNDGRMMVPPQLAEVARWLTELDTGVFEQLVSANPTVMLRCSNLWLDSAQRAALAESFIAAVDANRIEKNAGGEAVSKLAHPGLAAQLRPIFSDKSRKLRTRIAALDIAERCCAVEIGADVLSIMVDSAEPLRIRTCAAVLVLEQDRSVAGNALLKLVSPSVVKDWDIELRGAYLEIQWPDRITFTEAAALISVPRKRTYGSFENFLDKSFIQRLKPDDLLPALRWVTQTASQLHLHGKPLRVLIDRAFAQAEDADIRSELVKILSRRERHDEYESSGNTSEALTISKEVRRLIWSDIVHLPCHFGTWLFRVSNRQGRLLSNDDADWFAQQAVNDPTARANWIQLFRRVFNATSDQHYEASIPLHQLDPDLAIWISARRRTAQQVSTPPAAPVRQTKPTFDEKIDRLLGLSDKGNIHALGHAFELISGNDDHSSNHIPPEGLAAAPGWIRLKPDHRERMRTGMTKLLLEYIPKQPDYAKTEFIITDKAGVHFLAYLQAREPKVLEQLEPAVWPQWLPTIISFGSFSELNQLHTWPALLQRAWRDNAGQGLAELRRLVGARNNSHLPEIVEAAPVPLLELEDLCLKFLEAAKHTRVAIRSVDNLLSPRNSARWLQWLELEAKSSDTKQSSRWHLSANALLISIQTVKHQPEIFRLMFAQLDWGRAVAGFLAQSPGRNRWMQRVSAADLLELYGWMETFSGDPYFDNDDDDDGSVTLAHELYDFRRAVFAEVHGRATPEAAAAMAHYIASDATKRMWLGDTLADMRHSELEASWIPMSPNQLWQFLRNPIYPPLNSEKDLFNAVKIALNRYQETLRGETPSQELWSKPPAGKNKYYWAPKDEKVVRDCILIFLRRELEPLGVTVVPEVEARGQLGNAQTEELDILVTMPLGSARACVVVEIKGTWNQGLITDLKDQLADRYMEHHSSRHGLYVPVHFGCPSWDLPNDGRRKAKYSKSTLEEILKLLEQSLVALPRNGKTVEILLVDGRIGKLP